MAGPRGSERRRLAKLSGREKGRRERGAFAWWLGSKPGLGEMKAQAGRWSARLRGRRLGQQGMGEGAAG